MPKDLQVEVRDFDCETFDEHELKTDAEGQKYAMLLYAGQGLIDTSVVPQHSEENNGSELETITAVAE